MLEPRPSITIDQLCERLQALDRLTDAKFITMSQFIEIQADKVELALAAADKAISKAEVATEKRFDAVNEFRNALSDQTRAFVTREVFEQIFATSQADRVSLHQSVEDIRLTLTENITRIELRTMIDTHEKVHEALRQNVDALRNSQTRMVGIAVGLSAAITLISTLTAVIFRLAGN